MLLGDDVGVHSLSAVRLTKKHATLKALGIGALAGLPTAQYKGMTELMGRNTWGDCGHHICIVYDACDVA